MSANGWARARWVKVEQCASCKYCGTADLAWLQSTSTGKWYLARAQRRSTGEIVANARSLHYCEPKRSDPRPPPACQADLDQWTKEIISAGYRALAQKHHPDHGGSTEAMQEINRAAERLREAAR